MLDWVGNLSLVTKTLLIPQNDWEKNLESSNNITQEVRKIFL